MLLTILSSVSFSCKDTIWSEVIKVSKTDYLGVWTAQNSREKTSYVQTQDPVTFNYSATETTVTETVTMVFQLGIARASGTMIEDSIKITSTTFVSGTGQTPVVKTGYYTIGETEGNDYMGKVAYLNVWDKTSNVHGVIADPYTTYTIISKSASAMKLSWTTFNNTPQNSVRYVVQLSK